MFRTASFRRSVVATLVVALSGIVAVATSPAAAAEAAGDGPVRGPEGSAAQPLVPVAADLSPTLRSLATASREMNARSSEKVEPSNAQVWPARGRPDRGYRNQPSTVAGPDRALQTERVAMDAPAIGENFAGLASADNVALGNGLLLPPDTNGAIGKGHYVQSINLAMAVYSKSGIRLLGPIEISTLFTGFGAQCATTDSGDPIVFYDHLADRWVVTQFLFIGGGTPVFGQCIAVSQTPDPTGAYYRYQYNWAGEPACSGLPCLRDYPKFGLWPDGYGFTSNDFDSDTFAFVGTSVGMFEREAMLDGDPGARLQLVLFDDSFFSFLPASLDGPPPPPGTREPFVRSLDDNRGDLVDGLDLWDLSVDFDDPGATTLTQRTESPLAVTAFDSTPCVGTGRDCIDQPGATSSQLLDALADRLLHRAQYRWWGDHASLVLNQTVDANGAERAGVRWYELSDTDQWNVAQQSTFSPDGDHRWMGSIAMDGSGNIALGYSVSSTTTNPAIRYTGRTADAAPNTLQSEATLQAGGGIQQHTASRWGDYSAMAVDPTDDCTFWYTNEYYASTSMSGWATKIGSFRFDDACQTGSTMFGYVTDRDTGAPIDGATVMANGYETMTNASGRYEFPRLPEGLVAPQASAYGYRQATFPFGTITVGEAERIDIEMVALRLVSVQGTITDADNGWPAYGQVSLRAQGLERARVFSDPVTGFYEATVPEFTAFDVNVTGGRRGYQDTGGAIFTSSGTSTLDWNLLPAVNQGAMCAPGYSLDGFLEGFRDGVTPSGWTVVDHLASGDPDHVWRFDSPGARGNLTGGGGGFATIDSDFAGPGQSQDTSLVSPEMDFSGQSSVFLEFDHDLDILSSENADIDVNVGAGWVTVQAFTTDQVQDHVVLDLSAQLAGQPSAQIRFHYYDATWEWWWQVDNIAIGSCAAIPSAGLIVGRASDVVTGLPIDGALVNSGFLGGQTLSLPTPNDPAEREGLFFVTSPPGVRSINGFFGDSSYVNTATVATGELTRSDVLFGDAVDPSAPTMGALPFVTVGTSVPISWSGGMDPDPGTGISQYTICFARTAYNSNTPSALSCVIGAAAAGSINFAVAAGYTYCFRAFLTDRASNESALSGRVCTSIPIDDPALKVVTGAWTRAGLPAAANHYRDTFSRATATNAKLSRTGVQYERLSLIVTKCNGCATIKVYRGTTLLATVSLQSPTTKRKQIILIHNAGVLAIGTVSMKITSTGGKPATIDGMAVYNNG